MKITINVDPNVKETQIHIDCSQLTQETEKLLATLRMLNQQMMVNKKVLV